MRILFLTQYFPPETGAPQNRLLGLAQQLEQNGINVVVLTAMPNYPAMKIYDGYKGKFFVKEQVDSILVFRSWIYVSKKRTVWKRLLNYFSFVITSFIISFRIKGKFDFVFCESPPLFLGITGWLVSRLKGAKFIFNVSDLWPESAEKLGIISNRFFLNMAARLEMFLYRKSFLITGQTQGIVENISLRLPLKKVHWLPNGIDDEQFQNANYPTLRNELGFSDNDFIVVYAGIIGHAQGLEVILQAAAHLSAYGNVKFLIVGDGPEKDSLREQKNNAGLKNVFFHDAVPKNKSIRIINSCNVSVIPLKKLDLFKGAIPSKIFECLALEKPVLLGVDGEAKTLFMDEAQAGIYFEPENASQLAEGILTLMNSPERCKELGANGRNYVMNKFSRKKIALDFLEQLHTNKHTG